jgi:hypothetical protein
MRRLFLLLMGCLAGCNDEPAGGGAASSGGSGPTTRPALLAELESLPIGLHVTHAPAEVRDPSGPNTDARDWKYRWIFKTEVSAIAQPLTVTQFGILAWDGEHLDTATRPESLQLWRVGSAHIRGVVRVSRRDHRARQARHRPPKLGWQP